MTKETIALPRTYKLVPIAKVDDFGQASDYVEPLGDLMTRPEAISQAQAQGCTYMNVAAE